MFNTSFAIHHVHHLKSIQPFSIECGITNAINSTHKKKNLDIKLKNQIFSTFTFLDKCVCTGSVRERENHKNDSILLLSKHYKILVDFIFKKYCLNFIFTF